MAANQFVPKGLPLLCDAVLIKTMKEYGKTYASLSHSVFPSAYRLRQQIGLAMMAMEEELAARGIAGTIAHSEAMPDIHSGLLEQTTTSIKDHLRVVA